MDKGWIVYRGTCAQVYPKNGQSDFKWIASLPLMLSWRQCSLCCSARLLVHVQVVCSVGEVCW